MQSYIHGTAQSPAFRGVFDSLAALTSFIGNPVEGDTAAVSDSGGMSGGANGAKAMVLYSGNEWIVVFSCGTDTTQPDIPPDYVGYDLVGGVGTYLHQIALSTGPNAAVARLIVPPSPIAQANFIQSELNAALIDVGHASESILWVVNQDDTVTVWLAPYLNTPDWMRNAIVFYTGDSLVANLNQTPTTPTAH